LHPGSFIIYGEDMEPEELVENMVIWYGVKVPRSVFMDYLRTYIEMCKPDYCPLLVYKAVFSRGRTTEFVNAMNNLKVAVSG